MAFKPNQQNLTSDGIEIFDTVIQAPLRMQLHVETTAGFAEGLGDAGITPEVAGGAITDYYSSRIQQFVAASRQQRAISGLPQYSRILNVPGLSIQYSSNTGAETIRMIARPELAPQGVGLPGDFVQFKAINFVIAAGGLNAFGTNGAIFRLGGNKGVVLPTIGGLSLAEMEALKQRSSSALDDIVKKLDKNNNKIPSIDEFVQIYNGPGKLAPSGIPEGYLDNQVWVSTVVRMIAPPAPSRVKFDSNNNSSFVMGFGDPMTSVLHYGPTFPPHGPNTPWSDWQAEFIPPYPGVGAWLDKNGRVLDKAPDPIPVTAIQGLFTNGVYVTQNDISKYNGFQLIWITSGLDVQMVTVDPATGHLIVSQINGPSGLPNFSTLDSGGLIIGSHDLPDASQSSVDVMTDGSIVYLTLTPPDGSVGSFGTSASTMNLKRYTTDGNLSWSKDIPNGFVLPPGTATFSSNGYSLLLARSVSDTAFGQVAAIGNYILTTIVTPTWDVVQGNLYENVRNDWSIVAYDMDGNLVGTFPWGSDLAVSNYVRDTDGSLLEPNFFLSSIQNGHVGLLARPPRYPARM